MKKRILSLVLTLAMVLSFFPGMTITASAAEEEGVSFPTDPSGYTVITNDAEAWLGKELSTGFYLVEQDVTLIGADYSGVSALRVAPDAEVYIKVLEGVTLTVTGGSGGNGTDSAVGTIGGGAGILVPEGATLCLLGGGTVIATGGAAGNGEDGEAGEDSFLYSKAGNKISENPSKGTIVYYTRGSSGDGGDGGGGAGAGIGTAGGAGGKGGAGAEGDTEMINIKVFKDGENGEAGESGSPAAPAGTIYLSETLTVTATGGAGRNNVQTYAGDGVGGAAGANTPNSATGGFDPDYASKADTGFSENFYHGKIAVAGGSGGGGGAAGQKGANIGTGGGGSGGGGGGGTAGNIGLFGSDCNMAGSNAKALVPGNGGFGGVAYVKNSTVYGASGGKTSGGPHSLDSLRRGNPAVSSGYATNGDQPKDGWTAFQQGPFPPHWMIEKTGSYGYKYEVYGGLGGVGGNTGGQCTAYTYKFIHHNGTRDVSNPNDIGEMIWNGVEGNADGAALPRNYVFEGWYTEPNGEGKKATITIDGEECLATGTFHAAWINQDTGKIVRTTPLVLNSETERPQNPKAGWDWNAETGTLTLSGFTIDMMVEVWTLSGARNDANAKAIVLEQDTTIVLADGTVNSIRPHNTRSTTNGDHSAGIYGDGFDLTIEAEDRDAVLEIIPGRVVHTSEQKASKQSNVGIRLDGDGAELTIAGGTLIVDTPHSRHDPNIRFYGVDVFGLYSSTVTINGDANVKVLARSAQDTTYKKSHAIVGTLIFGDETKSAELYASSNGPVVSNEAGNKNNLNEASVLTAANFYTEPGSALSKPSEGADLSGTINSRTLKLSYSPSLMVDRTNGSTLTYGNLSDAEEFTVSPSLWLGADSQPVESVQNVKWTMYRITENGKAAVDGKTGTIEDFAALTDEAATVKPFTVNMTGLNAGDYELEVSATSPKDGSKQVVGSCTFEVEKASSDFSMTEMTAKLLYLPGSQVEIDFSEVMEEGGQLELVSSASLTCDINGSKATLTTQGEFNNKVDTTFAVDNSINHTRYYIYVEVVPVFKTVTVGDLSAGIVYGTDATVTADLTYREIDKENATVAVTWVDENGVATDTPPVEGLAIAVIDGEEVTQIQITAAAGVPVDTYKYRVSATDEEDTYVTDATVVVAPKPVDVIWSKTVFAVDNEAHVPTAELDSTDIFEDDEVNAGEVSGAASEVGIHTATLENLTGAAAKNYTISEATKTKSFEIAALKFTFEDGTAVTADNALTAPGSLEYGCTWEDMPEMVGGYMAKLGTGDDALTNNDETCFTLVWNEKGESMESPVVGARAYTLSFTGEVEGVAFEDVVVVSGTVNVAKKAVTIGLTEDMSVALRADLPTITLDLTGIYEADRAALNGIVPDISVNSGNPITVIGDYFITWDSVDEDKTDIETALGNNYAITYDWQATLNVYYDTCELLFAANGGTGEMEPVYHKYNTYYVLPECGFTAPEGKQFKAWTVDGIDYAVGAEIIVDGDMTVTAAWEDVPSEEPAETPDKTTYTVNVTIKKQQSDSDDYYLFDGATVTLVSAMGDPLMEADRFGKGKFTFADVPGGIYNVKVTYEDQSKTVLITVNGDSEQEYVILLPTMKINSDLTVTVDPAEDHPVKGASVGGLNDLADQYAQEIGTPALGTEVAIAVDMTVEAKATDDVSDVQKEPIQTAAQKQSDNLAFVDITIEKTITTTTGGVSDGGITSSVHETQNCLQIVIPFDTARKNNFAVYRYHNDISKFAEPVQKLTTTPNDYGEYIEIGNGFITMHVQFFSTYAIGFDLVSNTGGSGTTIYSVNVPDAEHGKVTGAPKSAAKNGTVKFTVTPDAGYQLGQLTVTGKSGKAIAVTNLGNGTYSFKMPGENVEIKATFCAGCPKDETCPIHPYKDASTTAWYHDGVHYCIENGIMNGYSATSFKPNGAVTRQQVWMTLARLSGEKPANSAEARAWAMANGVSDGTNPTKAVTRQQFITMLYRYAVDKGYDVSVGEETNILSYNDAFAISEYAIPAMQWGCGSGIMGGYSDGTLKPASGATRAHLAAFLQRFCEGA